MKFTPGIGVGGHCIPVDPTFLAYAAEKTGHQSEFIKLSNQVNQDMPRLVYEALNKYRNINGKRILVVGIAYKENISDVRESPGVKFLEILREHGISADWYDPVVKHWNSEKSADLALQNYDYGVYIKHHDLNLMDAIIDSCAEIVDLTGKIQSKNVVEFTGLGRKN
jgi:UDP-N-acetyl-D-glucosamine dehydrogenase